MRGVIEFLKELFSSGPALKCLERFHGVYAVTYACIHACIGHSVLASHQELKPPYSAERMCIRTIIDPYPYWCDTVQFQSRSGPTEIEYLNRDRLTYSLKVRKRNCHSREIQSQSSSAAIESFRGTSLSCVIINNNAPQVHNCIYLKPAGFSYIPTASNNRIASHIFDAPPDRWDVFDGHVYPSVTRLDSHRYRPLDTRRSGILTYTVA